MSERKISQITKYVKTRKRGLFILLFSVLVGTMLLRGVMQYPTLSAQKREVAELNAQIEYEEQRQKEVEELSKKVDTDEYVSKIASEKLGLVPSNAKIFVDMSDGQQ